MYVQREYLDYLTCVLHVTHSTGSIIAIEPAESFVRLRTFVTLKLKEIFVRVYATEELIRDYY